MIEIDKKVTLSLGDVIHGDFENFLDLLSVEAIGNELLMDINYELLGVERGMLLFRVTGEADEEFLDECEYCGKLDCHLDCDESQAGGFNDD